MCSRGVETNRLCGEAPAPVPPPLVVEDFTAETCLAGDLDKGAESYTSELVGFIGGKKLAEDQFVFKRGPWNDHSLTQELLEEMVVDSRKGIGVEGGDTASQVQDSVHHR